jgi:hypothetical protein
VSCENFKIPNRFKKFLIIHITIVVSIDAISFNFSSTPFEIKRKLEFFKNKKLKLQSKDQTIITV